MSDPTSDTERLQTRRSGLAFGLACYGIWGVLPLYFRLLDFASPLEIVANRALWTLLLCAGLLVWQRRLGQVRDVLRDKRRLGLLIVAAALIAGNWLVYVYAANFGHVLQASLGYYFNPLLTVMLGVVVLRERLRPMQWLAVGIGVIAVLIIGMDFGHVPWVALALAFTFGLYGLTKSFAGRSIGAVPSLTVETLVLAPLSLLVMSWMQVHGEAHLTGGGAGHTLLLLSTGLVTAVPLTFFAAAARRLPLSLVGMLQYIAPTLQLIVAVAIEHEPMSPARWVGFAVIWFALILISVDALRHNSRNAAARRRAATSSAECS